ncbi:hypothetical protein GCM10022234_00220 [Aeromicrobium panaciterrae]|uniref:hypothetical protein n=1 Tax=Aeromicrobium panaciterrae TaxID=363861 RepID=UPI0031E3CC2E
MNRNTLNRQSRLLLDPFGFPLATIGRRTPGRDPEPTDPPEGGPTVPPADPPKKDDPTDPPKKDDPPEDRGYPADTPVAEMTLEQQVAYHKYHSQKHEKRAKKLGDVTLEKYAEDMAELERLRQATLSDSEKAIEAARTEGRQAAQAETNLKVIKAHVDAFLEARNVDRTTISDTLEALNFEKFVKDGDVDTDKLHSVLTSLVPDAGKGGGRWPDTGQGKRGGTAKTKGVAAGRDLYESVHGTNK